MKHNELVITDGAFAAFLVMWCVIGVLIGLSIGKVVYSDNAQPEPKVQNGQVSAPWGGLPVRGPEIYKDVR